MNKQVIFLLMVVCVVEALFVQRYYTKLEPGQNVTGKIREIQADSETECFVE